MLRINEVSKAVNLSQKRIREYEKEGFIKPRREASTNNRIYNEFDVRQIKRINHLIHEKGYTLSCLRNLLVLAPCWNIFDCSRRHDCPVYQKNHHFCWEVKRDRAGSGPDLCESCAVYLNRNHPKRQVLEHPGFFMQRGNI